MNTNKQFEHSKFIEKQDELDLFMWIVLKIEIDTQ